MPRIALITHVGLPALSDDDRLLLPALESRGIHGEAAAWDDPSVRWGEFDALVMRSAWNYHLEPDRFHRWLAEIETLGVPLWNPPSLLRWNADKRYLIELASRGIPIPNSRLLEAGSDTPLAVVLEQAGWHDAVVKPTVSASAHETWRVRGTPTADDEGRFRQLLATRALVVQRFIPQVVQEGEWSLVFLGGAFSHAVIKRPAGGDFRVQKEHGGTAEPCVPSAQLLDDARAIMARLPQRSLYARVDGCALAGRLLLMELELLEPALFLSADPRAPERFAEAIARLCTSG